MIIDIGYIGYFLLLLGLLNCLLLVTPKFATGVNLSEDIVLSASRLHFPILFISFICLIITFLGEDYSLDYVAKNSNSSLPIMYKISAAWAGHEGSMLLWCVVSSFWMFLASIYSKDLPHSLRINFLAIMGLLNLGFLLFVVATSNPFDRNMIIPIDGGDLNPLLQDFGLIIHPPMLYMGYVGLSVVFSFAIACCFENEFKKEWAQWIRPWVLGAWAFLTLGIALGSWWAYYELGWGGYWFWDPVENVALMPWLAGTALLHTVYVSSRSKNLIAWTIFLSILVFTLSLFGAFIVRSGIIDSVHSFANDPTRGLYLLGMSAFLISAPTMLFIKNLSKIFSVNRVKDFSKEFFIGANNVFFITAVFIIFLGISYPLILEAFSDSRVSVGSPFYNKVFAPLTFISSLFLVFSSYSKWSRDIALIEILKSSSVIFALTILSSIAIIYFLHNYEWWLIGGIFFGNLILIRYTALIIDSVISKKYFNQGSALAHIGFALLIVSISLNAALSSERTFSMSVGDEVEFNDNTIEFDKISLQRSSNFESLSADFIFSNGEDTFELYPEKRKYFVRGEITTESDISIKPIKDIYITIGEQQSNGKWIVNVQENYFIRLIWISAIIMSLGAALVIRRKVYV